ncbi:MAG: BrnA antitoxin family protein [Caulobacteraceae bacterium]
MPENKRAIGTDLDRLDAHEIQPEEYDDIPELSDEDFARGIVHVHGKLQTELQSAEAQVQISLMLDADVLSHFKAAGPDWAARMNAALRAAMTSPIAA